MYVTCADGNTTPRWATLSTALPLALLLKTCPTTGFVPCAE